MKKTFGKLLCVLLTVIIALGSVCFAFAEGDSGRIVTGSFNLTSFNVAGLPIPSAFSASKRNVPAATRIIADEINASDCEILSAQEDFNFHGILASRLNMEYRTLTSGGAGIGDGLNIFSKYPIYNVGRVAWETASGVFDGGADELTPKGILYCTVELAEGVYVDLYNIHADANEDPDSLQAKADQYDQLVRVIAEHSGDDRAVIISGDFNFNFALFREAYQNNRYAVDLYTKVMDDFIDQGYKDAWLEYNNDGNYAYSYAELRERYGCEYPRTWDTLDHVFYRDGKGISFEIENAYYDTFDSDRITWDGPLSDHAALRTTISYVAYLDEAAPADKLETERFDLSAYINHVISSVTSALSKIFAHFDELVELVRSKV